MSELNNKRQFDAMHLLSDLRRYKENTPEIPWIDPEWIAKMEAQRDEEEEGQENPDMSESQAMLQAERDAEAKVEND